MNENRTLYLECNSGISGDMVAAALLDLGADEKKLLETLKSLPVEGYELKIGRAIKSGIDCCDFAVLLDEAHENHDHDMEYLHGRERSCHEHHHAHGHHEHAHGEHDHHHAHGHTHEHRALPDILGLFERSTMTAGARRIAERIFRILAVAEAKAHNKPIDEVHFHEVGAVDSIVDIAAVAICLDDLSPKKVIVSALAEGSGTIRTQHGILPIPVPAVVNIAQAEGLELQASGAHGELVTPTGAAIAAAVRTAGELPKKYRILATGLGAGKRDYKVPGFVRAMWIEETGPQVLSKENRPPVILSKENRPPVILESNIDDCTGEALGYCMEQLLNAGARDVFYTPVYMKKNRPAWLLTVICDEERREELESIIFSETTTIGIRRILCERTVLSRREGSVQTSFGEVKAKIVTLPDGEERVYPEYESAAELARRAGVPLREVVK